MTTMDADINSTINDTEAQPQVDATPTDVETTPEDVTPSEDLPKSNSVAKLLKKKNDAETRAEEAEKGKVELAERVATLEKENQLNAFLKKFPKAEEKMEDLEALIESGEAGSLESAYKLSVASDPQLLAQLSQSNPFAGSVPTGIEQEKTLDQMSRDEVRQKAMEEAKKLKF